METRSSEQNEQQRIEATGNYKMGHIKKNGYDITIASPKDSVHSKKDANGDVE